MIPLLVMVPGAGIQADDFVTEGLIGDLAARHPGIRAVAIDPGMDSYLDGSVETRLLAGIDAARERGGRLFLAGISLGCQGILRCLRARPACAEAIVLLTPYVASSGAVAAATRAGGLRRSAPEDGLLRWLAATSPAALPRIVLGAAGSDRFAGQASLLADLWPAARRVSVAGGHDWASWRALWRLALDTDAFA